MARYEARLTDDPRRFLAVLGTLAAGRAAEHHVVATVAERLDEAGAGAPGTVLGWVAADGRPVGAAVRVAPHPLVLSPLPERAAGPLVAAALERAPDIDEVAGAEPAARVAATVAAEATGRRPRLRMAQLLHELGVPVEPRPMPPGRLRPAAEDDLPLLAAWWPAFGRDVGLPDEVDLDRVAELVRAGRVDLWDDGGPACMVGRTPPTLGLTRIAPVYTPPERRRRGYAGAAVWAVSRDALAAGHGCILYTDAANPTSNSVYRGVGFRPIAEAAMYALEPAGS